MDNRSIVVLVIIILLVLGIIVYATVSTNNITPTPSPTVTTTPNGNGLDTNSGTSSTSTSGGSGIFDYPENIRVSYTDIGFSPSQITIEEGDSVTFVNNSTGRMWVASSPHPTHTDYPEFDQKTSVNAGGSWTFTFPDSGTYLFHNHASSTRTGRVIVQ